MSDDRPLFRPLHEGSWGQDNAQNAMLPMSTHKQNNRYPKNSEAVRSVLDDYFYGPGQVPWQWDILV